MQEASSIFKAVEKAWERAEKPTSFSIKVLEEPVKNFFGMTVKSAKIALYFDESPAQQKPKNQQQPQPQMKKQHIQPQHPQQKEVKRTNPQPKQQPSSSVREQQPKTQPQQTTVQQVQAVYNNSWVPSMVAAADTWTQGMLQHFGKQARYTLTPHNNQLVIAFSEPLLETGKDKLFFSSLAYLLMQAIRYQFKSDARGLKVLLTVQK